MRDPEYLIQILQEASNRPDGWILCPRAVDANETKLNRYHHVEQLADAGHAEWSNPDGVARITSQGYDFLNAIEKQPDAKSKFLDLFNKGIPYANAVAKVLSLVEKLG